MFDIVSIGSATRDVFLGLDEFKTINSADFVTGKGLCLPFGSKLEIKKIVFASGGGSTNAAVTFARQGLKTACIGVVGRDFNGDDVIKELAGEGIETGYFQNKS